MVMIKRLGEELKVHAFFLITSYQYFFVFAFINKYARI